jgi:hypothetical protein
MKNPTRWHPTFVMTASLLAAACSKAESAPKPVEKAAPVTSTAAPSRAPAPVDPAEAFFVGRPGSEQLDKLFSAPNYHYTIKAPKDWTTGGINGGGYMAYPTDSSVAIVCDGTSGAAAPGTVPALLGRAPLRGKDFVAAGKPRVVKVGAKAFHALVGSGKAHVLGKDGGTVYYMDMGTVASGYADHLLCVFAVAPGAPKEAVSTLTTMVRSMTPYQGTNLWQLGEKQAAK